MRGVLATWLTWIVAGGGAVPVCAPSRSAVITGAVPTTLGSLPMRCAATLPSGDPPAGVTANLVSLLDLGPTVLALAGVAVPAWMAGRPFLGPRASRRELVIGARDRMDASPGFGRTVRDARFRYVRNFLPWLDGDELPDDAADVLITGA